MRRSLAAIAVLTVASLAACGDSGGDDTTDVTGGSEPTTTPTVSGGTEEAARQVVEDLLGYFSEQEADAVCALMTPENQQEAIEDSAEFSDSGRPAEDCEAAMKAGMQIAKAFGYDPTASEVTVVSVDGDIATVLEESSGMFEDTLYTLVWDGSQWLIDNDESADEILSDTDRWLANWCKVQPGMTVGEAEALMGDTTGEFLGDDYGIPQVEWSAKRYSFTAFLGDDERIAQLDTNESDLTAADKAKLGCESTRGSVY